MSLKVTGVKVPLEDVLDIQDTLACVDYPSVTMCPGERIVPDGYICWCGADNSMGECNKPRAEALEELKQQIAEDNFQFSIPVLF